MVSASLKDAQKQGEGHYTFLIHAVQGSASEGHLWGCNYPATTNYFLTGAFTLCLPHQEVAAEFPWLLVGATDCHAMGLIKWLFLLGGPPVWRYSVICTSVVPGL